MPLSDYFLETWVTRDGLPHNSVNAIAQTPDGYLWLATWEGIARFNGHEFRVFRREEVPGLLDDAVRTLHVGREGAIWAGSARGGLVRFHQGIWTALPPVDGLVRELLEEPDGRLWVATIRGGLYRIQPDGSRKHFGLEDGLPSDTVNGLAMDAKGRIWAGTTRGLAEIRGDRVVSYPASSGLPNGNVYVLRPLPGGGLLVGTERGAWRLTDGRARPVDARVGAEAVIDILPEADGTLWLGTVDGGVLRLASERLDRLSTEGGLPNSRVLALARDRQGSLWVGTNGGLVRARQAPIRTWTPRRGLPDGFVRAVLPAPGGSVWVGTSRGLATIPPEGGDAVTVGQAGGLAETSILALAPASGASLWVGTFKDGLLRWDGRRVVERIDSARGLPTNEVRTVLPAQGGSMWIGTAMGLVHWKAGVSRIWSSADGLPTDFIIALHESGDGTLWVGTGAGAARLSNGRLQPVDLASVDDVEYVFGFLPTERDDALWLATDRGMVRVDASGRPTGAVQREQGLPFEKIFAAVADAHGAVWLTGNQGVARVRFADLEAVADGRLEKLRSDTFGESDGMASAQANGNSSPAAALDAAGHIWVATAHGAARIDPTRALAAGAGSLNVEFEDFEANGQRINASGPVDLAAGTRRMRVRFAALDLLQSHRIAYRYQLQGFSDEWVDNGARREVQFTNLTPGTYLLGVEAYLPGSGSVLAHGQLQVTLAAYWWQRRSVWLLLVLALATLAVVAHRVRTSQLRRHEAHLRGLVDQRTADLREQTEVAERLARTDPLTSLANRRAFNEMIKQGSQLGLKRYCLLLVDIDHFKRVNDTWSHAAGDAALYEVAQVLSRSSRDRDIAARWGGEEFALLLRDCTAEQAVVVAERVRREVAEIDCSAFAPGLRLTVSIGIAEGAAGMTADGLIGHADGALYAAKRAGRDQVRSASSGRPG